MNQSITHLFLKKTYFIFWPYFKKFKNLDCHEKFTGNAILTGITAHHLKEAATIE